MKNLQPHDFFKACALDFSLVESVAKNIEEHYRQVNARKKRGGTRTLFVPSSNLRWIQDRILRSDLLAEVELADHVHGGVKGRSARTNASRHVGREIVLTIDLMNFFGSVTEFMVWEAIFQLGCSHDLSTLLTRLTTLHGSLPPGVSTSTLLANLVALKLDNALLQICKEDDIVYSRYVDDLTFSGNFNADKTLTDIRETVVREGFRINESKVRISRKHCRQIVTNIVVNSRLSLRKDFVREIYQDLYYCEKFGVIGHCERRKFDPGSFMRNLAARIGYLVSVAPEPGRILLRRYRALEDEKPAHKKESAASDSNELFLTDEELTEIFSDVGDYY